MALTLLDRRLHRTVIITAGYYSTELSRKVQTLHEQGCDVQQIMDQTGLKKASVHSYLPYTKGKYNLPDSTLNAERRRTYRTRKAACEKLLQEMDSTDAEKYLWAAIEAFEGYPFSTEKGLSFKYSLKGGEIFFSRKEKSVTTGNCAEGFQSSTTDPASRRLCEWPEEAGHIWRKLSVSGVCEDRCD